MGTAVCTCHCEPSNPAASGTAEWQQEVAALSSVAHEHVEVLACTTEDFAQVNLRRPHAAVNGSRALFERVNCSKAFARDPEQVAISVPSAPHVLSEPVIELPSPARSRAASEARMMMAQSTVLEDDMRSLMAALRKVEPAAPFRAVHFSDLKAHGRLPRSDSGLAQHVDRMPASTKVVFFSHRWLRPWQTQEECEQNGYRWAGEPHPDDDVNTKYHLLIVGVEHVATQKGWPMSEIAVWMDYACIDQDDISLRLAGVRSLIGYMAQCSFVIVPTKDAPEYNTVHRMPGDYGKRAWTRLEALGFYVMSLLEDLPHPELFYSAPNGKVKQLDYVLLPYTMPDTGLLAVEADRENIERHQRTLLSALHRSAMCGRQAAVGPALVASAGQGHPEKVEELLNDGIDVDTQDQQGITALWSAARQGHIDIVQMLLDRSADPNLAAKSGLAPIHCAAYEGEVQVVNVLIRGMANLDQTCNAGNTALLWAVQKVKDPEVLDKLVTLLIEGGAQVLGPARTVAEKLGNFEVAQRISQLKEEMHGHGLRIGESRCLSQTARDRESKTVQAAIARAQRLDSMRRDPIFMSDADGPRGVHGTPVFGSETSTLGNLVGQVSTMLTFTR